MKEETIKVDKSHYSPDSYIESHVFKLKTKLFTLLNGNNERQFIIAVKPVCFEKQKYYLILSEWENN